MEASHHCIDCAAAPHLTEEQIRLIGVETKRSQNKLMKRWRRATVLGYLILMLGVFLMYENGQNVSTAQQEALETSGKIVAVDGCNRDFNTINGLRTFVERAKLGAVRQARAGVLTPKQLAEQLAFYNKELLPFLTLPDCRDAVNVFDKNNGRVPVAHHP